MIKGTGEMAPAYVHIGTTMTVIASQAGADVPFCCNIRMAATAANDTDVSKNDNANIA